MKLNKLFLTVLGLSAVVLSACNDDDDDYTPGVPTSTQQVFFSNAQANQVEISPDATSFDISIMRGDSTAELTVPLEVTITEGSIFKAPSEVKFNAGKNTAAIAFTYDPAKIEYGRYDTITVAIADPAVATQYGLSSFTFTAGVTDWDEWRPWNEAGTATYNYSGVFFSGSDTGLNLIYRHNIINPNKYQFKLTPWAYFDPDDLTDAPELIFDYDKSTGLVVAQPCYTGYTGSDGAVMAGDYMYYFTVVRGKTVDEPLYGSFDEEQGIIKIPLAYYIEGLGSYGGDYETIVIDGYNRKDYSLEFKYQGRQTDIFGTEDYAFGTVTLGPDVASAKLAVATDATYDDVLAGLKDGSVEGVTVEKSGTVQIPGVSGTGYYYVIVVAFNEEGEAVNNAYGHFFFTSSKEQWTKLYDGTYTYGADVIELLEYNMSFYEGAETAAVYKSTTTEGLYTIKPWANAEANFGLVFWWDEETNELLVEGADTGDEDIYEIEGETYNDGPVVFCTLDMVGVPGFTSTYNAETKTFTFNGIYLTDVAAYGGVVETFVVDDGEASARNLWKRVPVAKSKASNKRQALPLSMKRALSPLKLKKCR